MRLLRRNHNGEFSLTEHFVPDIPRYAILSHRWEAEEVSFRDIMNGTGESKAGYKKIELCGKEVAIGRLRYF